MGLNQVVLAGKVKELPELKETNKGKKYSNLVIELEGEGKTTDENEAINEVSVLVLNNIAQKVVEYAQVGDTVAIKGEIRTVLKEQANGRNFYVYEIVANKVFFLGEE